MPRITVLLPIYNTADYLEETLCSLFAQDDPDYEILIVNDGSTDDWQAIVDKFDAKKLRVITQDNRGLVAALNRGIAEIDSELIARADGDDIYFANRLSAQRAHMAFSRADALSSRVINIDERGTILNLSGNNIGLFLQDPYHYPAREPYLQHPFMMIKTQVLNDIGGYRHAHLSEDSDLCWRLFDRYKIQTTDDVLGKYRIHTSSVSSGDVKKARVQALYAQLAALNAQRRRAGRESLSYQGQLADEIARAHSLAVLAAAYEGELEAGEMRWLLAASSAKLIDLAGWRNFRFEESDFAEAKANFAKADIDDFDNRAELRERIAKLRARQSHNQAGVNWLKRDGEAGRLARLWQKRPLL